MDSDTVGRPMEILLVEDDLEDAGLTMEALREGPVPCRVSLVRDGEEATDFLFRREHFSRAPRPDIVLLDVNLPKRDGREVLAEIRADSELRRIPVVILTGSDLEYGPFAGEKPEVEAYLTKPVDLEHFLEVVRSLRQYLLNDVILPQD